MPYRHTQRGMWIVISTLAFAALDAVIAWWTGQWMALVVMVVLIAVAFLFSSLTVEVGDSELRWHFGPGFWTYRLPLQEIETAIVVRNRWWYGWGIRGGRASGSITSPASTPSSCACGPAKSAASAPTIRKGLRRR
jgi:hypothetical protein